ncbi:MAG: hypothetical protein LH702_05065 [Phormidesmis sp. CAN_BIN44]|nr:hypothetical protein [Phormidesmis sp. CAN_BIN44]
MNTHFVTTQVDLQATPAEMQLAIESTLRTHGEPLRWAVTSVNTENQKAQIEAIVITLHD